MPLEARAVIGIDPGISGAVALVRVDAQSRNPQLITVADMPTASIKTNGSTKSHIILPQLAGMLALMRQQFPDLPVDVFIEQVNAMPGQGVTSMFRFGYAAGAAEGVVAGLGYRVHKVFPKEWQAKVRVPKDPDAGRLRASQLYPRLAHFFARKLDHNRADAALIATAGALILDAA